MKLRIKGNSLRLRLTKSEVENFDKSGVLEEKIEFDNSVFRYSLKITPNENNLSVFFNINEITFLIPSNFVKEWTETDRVGYENEIESSNGEKVYLLLEKDFKCHDDNKEDQSDYFENLKAH